MTARMKYMRRMERVKRNFRVVKVLVSMRLQNLMMFRLSFFGPFFIDGSLFLVQIAVFQSIYANVNRIGTWGKGEMILYIGTFSLINALNMMIYFFGVNGIPEKVKSGDMDLYLTKPVSPLLRLTFEKINPGSGMLILLSGLIIFYGIREGGIHLTSFGIAEYGFWILLMTVLFYEMEVILRSISFFTISGASVTKFEEAGLELCMQLPGIVFYGAYKVIFCLILPYGIMATIPVKSMIGELNGAEAWYGIFVVVVFTILTAVIWKTGLKHYNSASS